MTHPFLKISGIPDIKAFYERYPTEADFFREYPQMQAGGIGPWQSVQPQPIQAPWTKENSNLATFKPLPGPSSSAPASSQPESGIADYSIGFKSANTIMDLIGGIAAQVDNAKLDRDERNRYYNSLQPLNFNNPDLYGSGVGGLNSVGQAGGYINTGADNTNPNVVAEQNEMFDRNGVVYHIDPNAQGAQRHEDGGTPVNAERVLEATSTMKGRNEPSDKLLQLHPDVAEAITGFRPDKTVSHATALKKADEFFSAKRNRLLGKAQKIMDNPDADKYALESAKLNMMNASMLPTTMQLFDKLFLHQEHTKMANGIGNEANYAAGDTGAQAGGYGDLPTVNYRKHNIAVSYEDGSGPVNTDMANIPYSFQMKPEQPVMKPAAIPKFQFNPRKSVSFEKLYDDKGVLTGYSPVFDNYSYNDAKNEIQTLPDSFNGIPIAKGQAWDELWNNAHQGTNSGQWTKAGDGAPAKWPMAGLFAGMQAGGYSDQPNRKMFVQPDQWMADVPLWDMMNLHKTPVNYIEPQVHDAQLQGYSPNNAYNEVNSDYEGAIKNLPPDGAGIAMQAQLFANKAAADGQIAGQVTQYNNNIANQNTLYHKQYQDQAEQMRASALQNFAERVNRRNANFDMQRQLDRDQWMRNRQNLWATDFAVNKLLPAMYPYFNYDGSYSGKQYTFTTNDVSNR